MDHSSYSNVHATGSFRKIDNYQASFTTFVSATSWAEKLNQDLSVNLLGTYLCSRSARLVYPRNDPLQKGFCSVIQGFRMHKNIKFSWYIINKSYSAVFHICTCLLLKMQSRHQWICVHMYILTCSNDRLANASAKSGSKTWPSIDSCLHNSFRFSWGVSFAGFAYSCVCNAWQEDMLSVLREPVVWCFSLCWPVLFFEREIKIGLRQNWTMSHFQAGMSMQPD